MLRLFNKREKHSTVAARLPPSVTQSYSAVFPAAPQGDDRAQFPPASSPLLSQHADTTPPSSLPFASNTLGAGIMPTKKNWKTWITRKKSQKREDESIQPSPTPIAPSQSLSSEDETDNYEEPEDSDSDWDNNLPRARPKPQPIRRPPRSHANLRALTRNSLAVPPTLPPLLYFSSVNLFPRSSNPSTNLPFRNSMETEMFKTRLLRKLESRQLTASEEASISPFSNRAKPEPPKPSPKPNAEEAISDMGKVTGDGFSRGLRNWVKRPCFEERMAVWFAGQERPFQVTMRPNLALADLEYSRGVECLAGLHFVESEEPTVPSPNPPPPILPSFAPSTGVASKRGVRFSVQVDDQEDSIPLGLVLAKQREREERQRRMLEERQARLRQLQEEKEKEERRQAFEERRQKKYAEDIAAARERRELARAPGSFGESHALKEKYSNRLPPPPPLILGEDTFKQPLDSPSTKTAPLTPDFMERPVHPRPGFIASSSNSRRESAPVMSRTAFVNPMVMMPYSLSASSLPMQTWQIPPAAMMYDPMLVTGMTMDPNQFNAMFTGEGLRPWLSNHGRTGSSTPPSSSPGMTPPGSSSEDVRPSVRRRVPSYFSEDPRHPSSTGDLKRYSKLGREPSSGTDQTTDSTRPADASSSPQRSHSHGSKPVKRPTTSDSRSQQRRDSGLKPEYTEKVVRSLGRTHNTRPLSMASAPALPSPLKTLHSQEKLYPPRQSKPKSPSRPPLPLPSFPTSSVKTAAVEGRRAMNHSHSTSEVIPSAKSIHRQHARLNDFPNSSSRKSLGTLQQAAPPAAFQPSSASLSDKSWATPNWWNSPRTAVQ